MSLLQRPYPDLSIKVFSAHSVQLVVEEPLFDLQSLNEHFCARCLGTLRNTVLPHMLS